MSSTYMNRGRGRSLSQLSNPNDDELLSIEKHFDFVKKTFKYSISDLDHIILMLRTRLSAEDTYISSLFKVKKLASPNDSDESQLSFQRAVKMYESSVNDIIESRQRLKDTIQIEIDVLVKQKEMEQESLRNNKNMLSEVNSHYTSFRNRDIAKLQKTYTSKCEDLKTAKHNWDQQQLQQQQHQLKYPNDEINDQLKTNRSSLEMPALNNRLSGDYSSRDIDSVSILSFNNSDQQNKKGMAGLISQMRTRAAAPLDQNKQVTKFAKMKKDIAEADGEYRRGILVLETWRKKQYKATEEVNKQLKVTIKRKTDTVKTSLKNILRSELDSLQMEMNTTRTIYDAAASIDSTKDIQIFTMHYQSLGCVNPAPIRYENFYLEGKCKEVLFGGSLETYAIEHKTPVPMLVVKCIDAIESMGGLQKEGIYRVPGRQSNIEQLKHQFELDEDRVHLESFDVFTIAAVLKQYIRELGKPLFEFDVQTRSVYSKNIPQAQRFNVMETKLSKLSLAHRNTLLCIVRHLSKVNANSQINKMNIPNLAMVFTPVIFHDFNQVDEHYSSDWSPDDLFEDLILHYQVLFPIAEDNARRDIEPNLQKALNGQNPFKETSQSNLLYIINSVMPLPANNNMLLTQPMNPPTIPSNSSGASSPGGPLDYPYNVNYPPKLTTIIGTVPPSSAIMPQNQQRIALHQQQPQQANYTRSGSYPPAINTDPNTRIVPQRYQSEAIIYQQQQQQQDPKSAAVAGTFIKTPELFIINRSISENTITQRGSSITNNTPTTETAPYTTFSGPNSNENSSPLPSREGRAAAITLKRHSGTPQLIHAKSVAPPRHDSLRKPNARFQADGEKTLMTEEDVISPVPDQQPSSLLPPVPITTANEQSPVVPPIITTDTSSENDTVPPQKHAYYQPNIIQDFNLPTVTEKENLDCPTTTVTEPSLSESTEK